MNTFFWRGAVAAALALTAVAAPGQPGALSPEELYRKLSPSIWLVRAYDANDKLLGSGSAVVVGPETLATNCHVLEKGKRFTITNDNVAHGVQVQYSDVARDLCQITARNLKAPAVVLADSDTVVVGQRVFALGNPLGIERTLSDGLVSALHRKEETRDLERIQTTAPISPGSSGGGLFDVQGRLVGITTSHAKLGQNINFAIPINWLRELPARSQAAAAAPPPVAAATPQPRPRAPGPRQLGDVDAVPVTSDSCREEYRRYIKFPPPKAFTVTDQGRCTWQGGNHPSHPHLTRLFDPVPRAMELCTKLHGKSVGCTYYAIHDKVVYDR